MAIFIVKIDDDILRKAEGTKHQDPPSCYRQPEFWLQMVIDKALDISGASYCEIMTIMPMGPEPDCRTKR